MATEYVATLRLTFKADDDVEAQMIAELARERAESELDTEDDDDEVEQRHAVHRDEEADASSLLQLLFCRDCIRHVFLDDHHLSREALAVLRVDVVRERDGNRRGLFSAFRRDFDLAQVGIHSE